MLIWDTGRRLRGCSRCGMGRLKSGGDDRCKRYRYNRADPPEMRSTVSIDQCFCPAFY